MIQIFVFGASFGYGVGGEEGGWADYLKRGLHSRMFGKDGVGYQYELYNFAKPGATIDFVEETFKTQLNNYRRQGKVIAIFSLGMNNAKSEEQPGNYVSTLDEARRQMSDLLSESKASVDEVLFMAGGYVDESKTYPKHNPLNGGRSYFSNERLAQFGNAYREVCEQLGVTYVTNDVSATEWQEKYLLDDGLHPNTAGHAVIFSQLLPHIERALGDGK